MTAPVGFGYAARAERVAEDPRMSGVHARRDVAWDPILPYTHPDPRGCLGWA